MSQQGEWDKWCPERIWLVEHTSNDGCGLYDVEEKQPPTTEPAVEYRKVHKPPRPAYEYCAYTPRDPKGGHPTRCQNARMPGSRYCERHLALADVELEEQDFHMHDDG